MELPWQHAFPDVGFDENDSIWRNMDVILQFLHKDAKQKYFQNVHTVEYTW